jgi:adenosylmethionine-8-amino-7-oxononanoate aminotransferase
MLAPPFIIKEEEIKRAYDILEKLFWEAAEKRE